MDGMIDSGIHIERDLSRVDCYLIEPVDGSARSISVSATLLAELADAVERRGEDAVIAWLQLFAVTKAY